MTKADQAKLVTAMLAAADPLAGKGYVNRHTFEVALAADPEVVANPSDWLEVPGFDEVVSATYGGDDCDNMMRFARDFFAGRGLVVRYD